MKITLIPRLVYDPSSLLAAPTQRLKLEAVRRKPAMTIESISIQPISAQP
jgi:hypothetical protein